MPELGAVGVHAIFDRWPVGETIAFTQEVETLGYGALWVNEGFGRDPFVFLGHIAASTTKIALGVGIASIWKREAATTKGAAFSLAELSGGRFILGVGVSMPALVEGVLDRPFLHPAQMMADYLRAYASAPYDGPTPAVAPPVVVAARRPLMLRAASELADGIYPNLAPIEDVAAMREVLGPGRIIAASLPALPVTEPSEARRVARGYLDFYLGREPIVAHLRERGFTDDDLTKPGSDRLVDALVAWGDTDRIRRHVDELRAAGADHVSLVPLAVDGASPNLETLRLLAPALLDATE